jgi:ATP-dependent Clp protease protease subunit
MIHQPYGGTQGQAVDIQIQAKEILRMRQELDQIISHHTGQTLERVEKDSDRDFFMSPQEAKEYGLVDEVIFYRDLAKRKSEDAPPPPSTTT